MADEDKVKDPQQQETHDDGGIQSGEQQQAETFTQEQVNALIAKRLEREGKKHADYADLKKKAEQWDKAEVERMSELEKLQKQLGDEQTARLEAENLAQERLIRAEVMAQAASLGFANPAHAWSLIDVAEITVDDDGKVQGVQEALKALAESSNYLLGKAAAPNINAQAGGGQRKTPVKLTPDEAAAAEVFKMTPEAYAEMRGIDNVADYRKLKEKKK